MKKCLLIALLLGAGFLAAAQPQTVTNISEIRAQLAKTDLVYPYIDSSPAFPGGEAAWLKYADSTSILRQATESAKAQGMAGGVYTIVVRFAVMPDGSLSEIKTVGKPYGYGLETAARKLVAESGKWVPAHIEGSNAKAYLQLPVRFSIH